MSDSNDHIAEWTIMKTQSRTFVVEFKSSRRRPKDQAKSIWGNTDLKAMARETEADAPHLFEPVVPALQTGPEQKHEPVESPTPVETVALDQDHKTQPLPSDAPVEAATQFEPDAAVAVTVHPEVPSTTPPRKQRKLRSRPARTANAGGRKAPVVAAAVQPDDLVALEDENKRLKALMTVHLRQQNTALRDMLLRFADRAA
ncbi:MULTISPECIES: hypothetical protein [unclassified Rhizobium]|uniref:hypothetical protein n=1 Tax=unclassified Rhizobium TaxID=2613769 RepID=UPI002166DC6D|nr:MULTISPECIES: hypothetical protein [unclassified Rhizobium]MCS3742174.1 hypothetical protein [Rhizobium sp. BK661]MCS4094102.1 hypothetical protein [Rhizobium sp. BK176]